jgi:hypothetical protein
MGSADPDEDFSVNFVAQPLLNRVRARSKRSGSGFLSINCPLCVARGQTRPDTRKRCGIYININHVGVNCFNCGLKARYEPGKALSHNMRDFLMGIGVSDNEVKRMAYHAARLRRVVAANPELATSPTTFSAGFAHKPLPRDAKPISEWAAEGCTDPNFLDVATYMLSRGAAISESPVVYHWTPSQERGMHRRLIVPFLHEGRTVGWSARTIDAGVEPRYDSEVPTDFLFNNNVLTYPLRRYAILVEGVFDAIAIDGVGLLGARLNARQALWIVSAEKDVILVPDRDKSGQALVDVAMHYGWSVAFPRDRRENWWEEDVKDAADAAKRYGRLYTLRSIIASATSSKPKIQVMRRHLAI